MPDIEAFAEIGDYIDQPLRTYSTGMAVRLAFSVATARRPDVLIVDEALSVGDAYFAHKCIRRIREFQRGGRTILFVSHDPGAVKTLCARALLLDAGRLIQDGSPDVVLDYYNALIARREANQEILQAEMEGGRIATRSGTFEARLVEVDLLDGDGRPASRVRRRRAGPRPRPRRVRVDGHGPDRGHPHPRPRRQRRVRDQQLSRRPDPGDLRRRRRDRGRLRHPAESRRRRLHADGSRAQRRHAPRAQLRLVGQGDRVSDGARASPLFIGTAWLPVQIRVERAGAVAGSTRLAEPP